MHNTTPPPLMPAVAMNEAAQAAIDKEHLLQAQAQAEQRLQKLERWQQNLLVSDTEVFRVLRVAASLVKNQTPVFLAQKTVQFMDISQTRFSFRSGTYHAEPSVYEGFDLEPAVRSNPLTPERPDQPRYVLIQDDEQYLLISRIGEHSYRQHRISAYQPIHCLRIDIEPATQTQTSLQLQASKDWVREFCDLIEPLLAFEER